MGTIYLICGKICSGKSYYARQLQRKVQGISFSCDELMLSLFPEGLGEKHDVVSAAAREYLMQKAIEAAAIGCAVILDWGFWWADDRRNVTERLQQAAVPFEWHYIDVTDRRWEQNIAARNSLVLQGKTQDYYIDEGLKQKCLALFDVPKRDEMDQWILNE